MNLLFLVHKENPKFNPQKRESIAIGLDCGHGTASIVGYACSTILSKSASKGLFSYA
jgi:hypothetical protein